MEAIIAMLAQALGLDVARLTAAIEAAQVEATPVAEATCKAIAKSTGKSCTLKAGANGVCHLPQHGASVAPATKVTQATVTNVPAKLTALGIKHKGTLANRSSHKVAEALGMTEAERRELLKLDQAGVEAKLNAAGLTGEYVPATSL